MSLQVAVGIPGSGKTNWALGRAVTTAIERPRTGKLVIDLHGRMTKTFALWMIRKGQAHRMTYDDLNWDEVVPGYKLHDTMTSWSYRGEIDQEAIIEGWVQFLIGSMVREHGNVEQHPFYENARLAFQLVMRQSQPTRLTKVVHAFEFRQPAWESLMDGCWDGGTVQEVEHLAGLLRSTQEKECRPPDRATRRLFGSPILRERCDGDFDLIRHLASGGIHVVSGSPFVAESAQRMQAWMLIQRAIIGCMQHGFPLEIIIDEFDSLGVNPFIQRKAEEIRKFNCDLTVLSQSGDWGDYTERFLNAAASVRMFKMLNPTTRQRFAGFLDPQLDPHAVHHTDEQWHSETDYIPETRVTTGESWNGKFGDEYEKRETTSESTVLVPRVTSIRSTRDVFSSLDDQERLNSLRLWTQRVGASHVATADGVEQDYAPLVRPAFPAPLRRFGERQFQEYCQWLWTQPGYRKVTPPQPTEDAATRLARVWAARRGSNGHARIPPPFKN